MGDKVSISGTLSRPAAQLSHNAAARLDGSDHVKGLYVQNVLFGWEFYQLEESEVCYLWPPLQAKMEKNSKEMKYGPVSVKING